MTEEEALQLGFALNEACWVGLEVDPAPARAGLTFNVLTRDEQDAEPDDGRVLLVLVGVSRLAVYCAGLEVDAMVGPAEPLALEELPGAVRALAGSDLCGWEFVDLGDECFATEYPELSLDWESGAPVGPHTLDVWVTGDCNSYQPQARALRARFWFAEVELVDSERREITIPAFFAGAQRWWDALQRSRGHQSGPPNFAALPLNP